MKGLRIPQQISDEMFTLLEKALTFCALTKGNFDVTLLTTALYAGGTELYEAVASFCDSVIFIDENLTVKPLTN